mmetsp:Transcript_60832/g.106544  ORF Transcript_60832/g.106544 Transcript_60832/m.106544 type:complete len:212 (-) Transcript_60832:270-905(-)
MQFVQRLDAQRHRVLAHLQLLLELLQLSLAFEPRPCGDGRALLGCLAICLWCECSNWEPDAADTLQFAEHCAVTLISLDDLHHAAQSCAPKGVVLGADACGSACGEDEVLVGKKLRTGSRDECLHLGISTIAHLSHGSEQAMSGNLGIGLIHKRQRIGSLVAPVHLFRSWFFFTRCLCLIMGSQEPLFRQGAILRILRQPLRQILPCPAQF